MRYRKGELLKRKSAPDASYRVVETPALVRISPGSRPGYILKNVGRGTLWCCDWDIVEDDNKFYLAP